MSLQEKIHKIGQIKQDFIICSSAAMFKNLNNIYFNGEGILL